MSLPRREFLGAAAATVLARSNITAERYSGRQHVDKVKPFIGTTAPGVRWMMFPVVSMPFGVVKLSPDNKARSERAGSGRAGYDYKIFTILGPEGAWHDFWTGEKVAEGTELTAPASTEHIPVYVKSGSIVPWAEVSQCAGTAETRRITARVYGDGSLPFELKSEKAAMELSWSSGHGRGDASNYDVYRWEHLG